MNKKNKTKKHMLASVLSLILLLSGTYAWQSFSQVVSNEMISKVDTPGARLHDYFNGTNKDVFVENYAVGDQAPNVYARIKLSEYFEYGKGAGTTEALNPTIVRGDIQSSSLPTIGNVTTWDIFDFGSVVETDVESIRTYRELETGGEGVYLPTYNQDNESLEPEVNGTFGGLSGDGRENKESRYNDYVSFVPGQAYDVNKQETAQSNAKIASATAFAKAISMSEWEGFDEEEKLGDYWVFDTTGWAYYAKPIQSSSATGLLLDGITTIKNPKEEWYYAVEVTAQLATFGDWGEESEDGVSEGTGMYGELTDSAAKLLNFISKVDTSLSTDENEDYESESQYNIESFQIQGLPQGYSGEDAVQLSVGERLDLTVEVTADDGTKPVEIQGVEWSITEYSKSLRGDNIENTFEDGQFIPITGMEDTSYVLSAVSTYDDAFFDSVVVEVLEEDIYAVLDLDIRYTYAALETDKLKEIYKQLALGLYNMEEVVYITVEGYENTLLKELLLAVFSDFPEFIWSDIGFYNYSDRVVLEYSLTKDQVTDMMEEVDEAEREYIETLSPSMTDYEKVLHTFRYVIDNVDYVMENHHQTIYGAMVANEAVCAGYARMFQYLLMRQGLECAYITGDGYMSTSVEYHGWNLVKLDGEYYYVDTTWGDDHAIEDRYVYYYMTQSYENMKNTHVDDTLYAIPYDEFGTKYNYTIYNSILFEEYNQNAVKEAWSNMYKEGMTQYDVQFTNDAAYIEAFADLYTNQNIVGVISEISVGNLAGISTSISNAKRTITFFARYSVGLVYDINYKVQMEKFTELRFE